MPLAPVRIRRPRRWENATVLAVDHAAFGPLWQMRAYDLREAGRRASHYTVAHDGNQMVGYQLSIRYGRSLHLARLAILPACQNQGVGSALVHDLLNFAEASGIEQVTVNTQHSNLSSQRLYQRMGFEPDGSSLPVYTWNFSAAENPS
jgi:ribosomal protein S18 acetylase RimI-like enzyme